MTLNGRDRRRRISRAGFDIPGRAIIPIHQAIAYVMQTDPINRTYISEARLYAAVVQQMAMFTDRRWHAEAVPDGITEFGLLVHAGTAENGRTFAFAHTAIREYLAGSYIARQDMASLPNQLLGMPIDASSQAVARMALQLTATHRTRSQLEHLVKQWRQAPNDQLAAMAEDIFGLTAEH